MELSKQVVNLELSKKIKELGVKQESLFYYTVAHGPKGSTYYSETRLSKYKSSVKISKNGDRFYNYSAFTAQELLEILPTNINNYKLCVLKQLLVEKYDVRYFNFFIDKNIKDPYLIFTDENLSNALAEMLIYLIENKLYKLDN